MKLSERICEKAMEIGFDIVGIGPAQPAHADAFRRWLDAGRAGGMSWLAKDRGRRLHPDAKTAIVCGLSYFIRDPPPEIWNDPSRGRIARYAWGRDYHDVILPMLNELADFVRAEIGPHGGLKTYVDTGPVLERDLAAQAGLGFVGKNTNLIHPGFGSYIILSEILLDFPFPVSRSPFPIETSCGPCTRCLTTCPTGALVEPYSLDSRRCISYLTIENKGSIPEKLRPRMGNWIFGCDECQQICPWVQKSISHRENKNEILRPEPLGTQNDKRKKMSSLVPMRSAIGTRDLSSGNRFLRFDPDLCAPKLIELMALDDAGFRDRFAGTPVLRAKRRGLLRNVTVALGNGVDRAMIPVLERAVRDRDELIREHATWALEKIRA